MFENTKLLKYGIEDEVEAFSFAHNFSTAGNPTEQIDESWVRNQEIKYTDAEGQQQSEKPYQNIGNGGNYLAHVVSSNPNG